MSTFNSEIVGKKTLVKIHQKNRFDIIDHPCEWKYYLSANLETESTVKILSDAIKEIIENAIDYIHIENISVLQGFELIEEHLCLQ